MLHLSPNKSASSKTGTSATSSLKAGTKTKKTISSPFKSPVKRASVVDAYKTSISGRYASKPSLKVTKTTQSPGTKNVISDSNCKISF